MGSENLTQERTTIHDAIGSLRLTRPWAFEFSPARPDPPANVYLEEVRRSDLLVCLVSHTHSDAVQAELEAAENAGIPILAFVRQVDPGFTQTSERRQVLQWLAARVKYQLFSSDVDLRDKVITSIVSELVRGYRQYRIDRADLQTLVERVPSPPGLLVRPAAASERGDLSRILRDLVNWYPNIGPWIEKVLADVGSSSEIRVADLRGDIAGIAVSRDKEQGVRKYSTIYVRPGFQGEAIGPHLIYDEVQRSARENVRKSYVTFADELRASIGPLLKRYGFQYEGVATSRYRPGSAEWVMGKTFSYETIGPTEFLRFVKTHFIAERAGRVIETHGTRLIVKLPDEPLLGNIEAPALSLVVSTSSQPESDHREWEEVLGEQNWVFLSLYGRPADLGHWSNDVANWLDGEDLAAMFFPVSFVTSEQPSLICTIRPNYADGLIPSFERPQLLSPSRLQVRPDNVFYRAPDRFATLRRGARLFFYVSSPEKAVRGFGRLQGYRVAPPEECMQAFGTMGILSFDALDRIAKTRTARGNVLALVFDWYKEYADKPNLDKIKEIIPNFNPVGANTISYERSEALISL